jgi:hypothetical protein
MGFSQQDAIHLTTVNKHLLTCLLSAAQWIQCQPFCDDGGSPGFPEESALEPIAFRSCSGCCSKGPANDSNFRGRCADKEDPSEEWLNFFHGKFYWFGKRPLWISAGAPRQLWIDVRADIPGPFTC